MPFTCMDLSWNPFSHSGDLRLPQTRRETAPPLAVTHRSVWSILFRSQPWHATVQGCSRLSVPLWQPPPKDSSETFSSLDFLQSTLLGKQNYIKQWLQKLCCLRCVLGGIFPSSFCFNSFRKSRRCCFLLVCLLLRSTIIGETSRFLMGYFSSVFFLCFVYSPNTVTSQFMKVFASYV